MTDAEIVARVCAGEHGLYEVLMRRHNQRLYRAARAIVGNVADVEDVLQQTYMNAFSYLHQFEARAQFSTWLTRILINEASHRRRTRQRAPMPVEPARDSREDVLDGYVRTPANYGGCWKRQSMRCPRLTGSSSCCVTSKGSPPPRRRTCLDWATKP